MSTRNVTLALSVCFLFAINGSSANAYETIVQSLTSDIWNEGSASAFNYADGYNNNGTNSTVELVRFVGLSAADPYNIAYTQGVDTVNLASFIQATGGQRGAAQGMKVNGYTLTNGATPVPGPGVGDNLYLVGNADVNNEGFGAHANWIVTFDLDDIRTTHFGGRDLPISLTGDFGIYAEASDPREAQGVIYVDGVRIDTMAEATDSPVNNPSFDLTINSGRWLTFGIFNGDGTLDDTVWDDALFQNVNLTMSVIPEPSTGLLLAIGLAGLVQRRRRSGSTRRQTPMLTFAVASVTLLSFSSVASAGYLYSNTVLADGPVGYWRLDETTATAVNSGSGGAGINGTYTNFPSGVQGVSGLINANNNAAANFNGVQGATGSQVTGSGISTAAGGSNPFQNDWTIEAWFVRNSQNQWSGIFSNNNGSVGAPIMTFIDNTHSIGINGAGITAANVGLDLGAGSIGEKVYAVITKTGGNADSAAALTIYANVGGTWLTPATGTNAGWALAPGDGFYVGRHYTGGTQLHDGIIDEVAIYDFALSAEQITAHYNAGASFAAPEPSTLLMGCVGLLACGWRRNRRTSASLIAFVVAVLGSSQAEAGVYYSDTVLADNPVGYWRLDDTGATAVNSGTGGAVINGTYANFPPGVQGAAGLINANNNGAANLNGATQTAADAVINGGGLNSVAGGNPFANDWSIEAWFVRDSVNAWSAIFSNNNGGTQGPLMTFNGASNLLGINGAGATANNVSVDLGASLGDKVYAVVTKTGGNGDSASTITVYANVDGTWLSPVSGTNVGWTHTANDGFYIGRHFSGA
ncbi:MAG: PEP-CTERM sorting domain-containing protein, partial [Planctomycetales bacterium]|nr:PEP-CTERM sorting domain-containing protein [Planctomycetales bacterium]